MKIQRIILASASAGLIVLAFGVGARAAIPQNGPSSGDTCPIGQNYNPLTSICEGQAVDSFVPNAKLGTVDETRHHVIWRHGHRYVQQGG